MSSPNTSKARVLCTPPSSSLAQWQDATDGYRHHCDVHGAQYFTVGLVWFGTQFLAASAVLPFSMVANYC
eukprot:3195178-Amphidinium_carterae.1